MRQEVRWTDLNYEQIADHLAEEGTPVSVPVVKQLLDLHDYRTRNTVVSYADLTAGNLNHSSRDQT
jgi:hypothetical protein